MQKSEESERDDDLASRFAVRVDAELPWGVFMFVFVFARVWVFLCLYSSTWCESLADLSGVDL